MKLTSSYDTSQYGHTSWTAQSGSFRGSIQAITQTSDGYLWLGTTFGLLRFDGVRFTEWNPPGTRDSLPEAGVSTLLGASDGSLWIGRILGGLTQWKNGKLTRFPELDGGSVFAILEDREGTIWVGGGKENKTLCRIRSGVLDCLDDKVINDAAGPLYQDRKGRVWASIGSNQLCEVQLDHPRCYLDPNGPPLDLAEDIDGRLVLAGTAELRFLSRNGKIENYPLRLAGEGIVARSLLMDREGGLWIGSEGKGLVHVHEGRVDTFTKDDGLSSNSSFFKIFEDREGSIWVASFAGLDRFRRLAIPSLTKRQGLSSDYSFSILGAQDGSIWLGTENGLNHLKDNTIEVYDKRNGAGNSVDSMFQTSDGRLLAVSGGLYRVENGRITKLPIDIGENIFGIVEDARGDLWIVSNTIGLIHLSKAGTLIEKFDKRTFPLRLLQLAYDPGRDGLWLSDKDGHFGFFKNGKVIERYGPENGLGTGRLVDVQVGKDGAVWVSTRVGLARLRNGKIAVLNQKAGLPCNATHWIRADDEGTFWIYTECGIVHLSQEDLAAWDAQPEHRVTPLDFFNNMDGADNAAFNSWYSPQVAKMSDGRLLFVQHSGVGIIDPRHIVRNVLPPPVHIEGIIADQRNYPAEDNLSLPALTRDLEIDYTALSLVVPEKVRFRYILDGHDADWQDPGNRRQAFYNQLRPGTYTFRVIACNNDGVWNNTGASLTFRVAPAWYQTYWFLLLCTLTGLIVVWAIYTLRVRQLARAMSTRFDERLAERTRIARELHDTLLQTVQGSKFVADDALEKSDDSVPVPVRQSLERLSKWLGQATQEGRAALNSLRTSTIETNDLTAALRRATEECVIDSSMAVKFSATGGPRDLHPIARDEIYRIGYEAIRNACEHASASELEIALTYAQDLTLRVSDNGIGINPATITEGKAGHFGLQGMRERAERIGSKFTLVSSPDSGTEMILVVPGNVIFRKASATRFERIKTFFGLDGSSDQR